MSRLTLYCGEGAGETARRKARYGHRDWLLWRDRDGMLYAAPATPYTCKLAMLATGTQKTFTRIEPDGTRLSSSCWSIATAWWANLKREFLS